MVLLLFGNLILGVCCCGFLVFLLLGVVGFGGKLYLESVIIILWFLVWFCFVLLFVNGEYCL